MHAAADAGCRACRRALRPAGALHAPQEYEKTTGKVSSQSKEAFRAALVGAVAER